MVVCDGGVWVVRAQCDKAGRPGGADPCEQRDARVTRRGRVKAGAYERHGRRGYVDFSPSVSVNRANSDGQKSLIAGNSLSSSPPSTLTPPKEQKYGHHTIPQLTPNEHDGKTRETGRRGDEHREEH